ncbi:MAG: hypothetical protein CMC35_08425 [Flavobacteriaceae bacterium]|nr:hypothetical protein [Flavobacteriaceae bacterium]
MPKYIVSIAIFCFMGMLTQSVASPSSYVEAIFHMDYEKAKNIYFDNHETQHYSTLLATILQDYGQIPTSYSFFSTPEREEAQNILASLSKGYINLYQTKNMLDVLPHFMNAYTLSKQQDNTPYLKLSLYAILEFYRFEYAQTNSLHQNYLDEFGSLAEDPIEEIWHQVFTLYFNYQSIEPNNRDGKNYIDTLTQLVDTHLPQEHPIYAIALSMQAFQQELNGDLEKAIALHKQCLTLCGNYNFLKYLCFRSHYRLSEIEYANANFTKSLEWAHGMKNFVDNADTLKSQIYINKLLAKNNAELQNYELAYRQYEYAVQNQFKLDLRENTLQNSKMEIDLRTAEKEKQLLLEQEKRTRNRNIAIGLGGGLAAVLLLSVLLYKNSKKKQRIAEQEREIEIQKKEKILKEQELNAIDAMIAGQEKERQRLAADLHDSVGATLSAAKLQFDHLKKNKDKLATLETMFQKTGSLLDEAYNEVRSMAHVKHSGVIAKEGLLPAVEKLARNASLQQSLQVEVQDFGLTERLEPSLEISIFRMIQELVTNIIKHANASEATIAITQHENSLNIIVEDNGKGFNATKFQQKEGMGLSSIERRVEFLEGTLEIDATPGKGTTILIDIPL